MTKILHKNPYNPSALLYSQLDQLERYRTYDGKFHLKIVYPELGRSNEWKQMSNPVTDTIIKGFQAIRLDMKKKQKNDNGQKMPWGGMGLCYNFRTLMCDTPPRKPGYWWMAVGAKQDYKNVIPGKIPGPWNVGVRKVEMYVKLGR